MKKVIQLSVILLWFCNFCYGQQHEHTKKDTKKMEMGTVKPLDIASIEKITGMKGKESNGQYKITVAQNDLNVTVDGFKIIPPMGLGSWAAFSPASDGAMVMGDIILTETDLLLFSRRLSGRG